METLVGGRPRLLTGDDDVVQPRCWTSPRFPVAAAFARCAPTAESTIRSRKDESALASARVGPSCDVMSAMFITCSFGLGWPWHGRYEIPTRQPPFVSTLDGTLQAPHLSVSVFARGLLDRVVTRIYFGDEAAANDADPTLGIVAAERRPRLVAEPDADRSYRFDIRLQGDDESVFFSI